MSRSLPILVYHSVSAAVAPAFSAYAVAPEQFADHVAALKALKFTSLQLTEAAHRLFNAGSLPARTVVFTFDDAFQDFFDSAFPILSDAGFVATLFVPSAYIGLTSRWLVEEGESRRPIMTWDEILTVADAGIEIGAHTHTHPQLDRLRAEDLQDELSRPKGILEDGLGRTISSVAYPFGFHSARVRQAAREAGYRYACAVGNVTPTSKSNPWAIPRQTVRDTADADTIVRLLSHESTPVERGVAETKRIAWRARRRLAGAPVRVDVPR